MYIIQFILFEAKIFDGTFDSLFPIPNGAISQREIIRVNMIVFR